MWGLKGISFSPVFGSKNMKQKDAMISPWYNGGGVIGVRMENGMETANI